MEVKLLVLGESTGDLQGIIPLVNLCDMKKLVLAIGTILLIHLTVLAGWVLKHRLSLLYNSEGRYIDEKNGVVYDQQAIEVYGLITLALFALSGWMAYLTLKKR